MKINRGIKAFIPSISWALIILFLSVIPSYELPDTEIEFSDKIGHFVVYLILSFLLVRDYRRISTNRITIRGWALFFIIAVGYGLLLEFLQACCIPSRFGEVIDALANSSGAIFGLILVSKLK